MVSYSRTYPAEIFLLKINPPITLTTSNVQKTVAIKNLGIQDISLSTLTWKEPTN